MPEYSPILAVVTGCFELLAALYTLTGPGRKRILYPVGLILLLLAGYQFAEVAVCANPGNLSLSRLSFFEITWLPPVGIWLIALLIRPGRKWLKAAALAYFTAAAAICVWISADAGCITKSVCQVVVARYFQSSLFEIVYGVFYQSGLAVMVFGAAAGMAQADDIVLRKHLANVQVGVLGFMLPALVLRFLVREPLGILPSVMCHFALVFAVSLVALVVRERRLQSHPAL